MRHGALILDEGNLKIQSNKPLADHKLIDRTILQHMVEEWNEVALDQVVFFIDKAERYQVYETKKVLIKELTDNLDLDSYSFIVRGNYCLLEHEMINRILKNPGLVESNDDFFIKQSFTGYVSKSKVKESLDSRLLLKIESRKDIILANEILTDKIIQYWTSNGATIMNGNIIGKDVVLGTDVYIHQGNQIIGKSQLGDEVEIIGQSFLQNVHLENKVTVKNSTLTDSKVGEGSVVGPYAHLRNQTDIGKSCRIGNYVELKNTHFDDYSAVSHLSYLGDARIGKHVNIGCHVVTVNYDGKNKHQTIIKDKTFIGSASNLIAPVSIGENVVVAAGSTITEDIADGEMAFARSRQINKPELGKKYLERDK